MGEGSMNPRNREHIARALRILRGEEAITPKETAAFQQRVAAEMARALQRRDTNKQREMPL